MRDSARGAIPGRHRVASTRWMTGERFHCSKSDSDSIDLRLIDWRAVARKADYQTKPARPATSEFCRTKPTGSAKTQFCETKPSRPATSEFCRTKPTGSAKTDSAKRSHRDQRRPNSTERSQRDQRRPILRNEAIATSDAPILPNEANYETVGLDRRIQADGLFSRCAPG
jgi:hypothetical protein